MRRISGKFMTQSPKGLAKSIFGKTISERICYMHLPKCGGTSLNDAIRKSYGFRDRVVDKSLVSIGARNAFAASAITSRDVRIYMEDVLLYHLLKPTIKYVSGHFACPPSIVDHFKDQWSFVTVLRNPVERWFSEYFYKRYRHENENRSLEEYLESQKGVRAGYSYLPALTGIFPDPEHGFEQPVEEIVQLALDNLKHFSVVGIIERMDNFLQDFQSHFGVALEMPALNTNPVQKERQEQFISDEVRDRVNEICRPNMLLYNKILSWKAGSWAGSES